MRVYIKIIFALGAMVLLSYFKSFFVPGSIYQKKPGPLLAIDSEKQCYLYKSDPEVIYDSSIHYIEVNFSENGLVYGYDNWIPAEKSKNTGSFQGIREGNYLRVIHGKGEAQIPKEERFYKITSHGIIQGYSKESGVENEKGIYVYSESPEAIFNNENIIPRVDCHSIIKW